jgi:chorismate synthase
VGNHFGHLFRITTFGESHGGAVGVVVDGCPPRLALSVDDVQQELDRRRPGQSSVSTPRQEPDRVQLLSGVFEGQTLGTPIAMLVHNQDARPGDYREMRDKFRPSHADYTYQAKYGIRNYQGGGRSSARETIGRVAGGAVARRVLKSLWDIDIVGFVRQVHGLRTEVDAAAVTRQAVEANVVRCPDPKVAEAMIRHIEAMRDAGDSVGGLVEAVAHQVPPGLGDPVFDKLEASLARAMLSLPAARGFEIGSGFDSIRMTGKEHNDPFYMEGDRVRTRTNRSGGVQGGISNGEDVVIRVAFKPTATVKVEQETVDMGHQETTLAARGRHDPCVLPRAVPIVEAMMALVLVDHALIQRGQCG